MSEKRGPRPEPFKDASRTLHQELDGSERVVAEGRFDEMRVPLDALVSGSGHHYLLVTDYRILFMPVWRPEHRVSLQLNTISSFSEAPHGHRWYLRLVHEPIWRYRLRGQPRRWLRFGYKIVPEAETFLRFSRRDTVAAKALRGLLEDRQVARVEWDPKLPPIEPRRRVLLRSWSA